MSRVRTPASTTRRRVQPLRLAPVVTPPDPDPSGAYVGATNTGSTYLGGTA